MELRAKELKSQEAMLQTKVITVHCVSDLSLTHWLQKNRWILSVCYQAAELKRRRKKLGEEEDDLDRQLEVEKLTFFSREQG